MELNQIGTINVTSDVYKPFCLHSYDDYFSLTTKQSIYLFYLNYRSISDDSAVNFDELRIPCNQKLPTSIIQKRETKIYNAARMDDRHRMMLDQTLLPNAASYYLICSTIGEMASEPHKITAHMNNAGQLTFYQRNLKTSNMDEIVDVSKHLIGELYDKSNYLNFEDYEKTVSNILIISFCFRDKIISHNVQFCISTKSGKIIIFSLDENVPKIEYTFESGQVNSYLKWITLQRTKTGSKNLLLVCRQNGKLSLFTFETILTGEVSNFEFLIDLWTEEDELPISHVEAQVCSKSKNILIIFTKGSFLLAFYVGFDGNVHSKVIKDIEQFTITGLQQIEDFKFLLCTLPGTIFHLTFSVAKKTLNLQMDKVKTDFDQFKYCVYGITTTKNRPCVILATFPSQPFDHSILRDPTRLIICLYSERDPFEIIANNPTMKMTNYYDCAEIIRIYGAKQLSAVPDIDTLNEEISRTDEHVYQLKLRLVFLSAKISYFRRRNQTLAENNTAEFEIISRIISLIHYSKALEYITNLKSKTDSSLTEKQFRSARMCRNLVQQYLNEEPDEKFKAFQEMLRSEFTEIVKTGSYVDELTIPAENCTICGHIILRDFVECMNEHVSLKCAISGLPILPTQENAACRKCYRSCLLLEDLQEIFPTTIDCTMCPVCDIEFGMLTT